MKILKNYKSTLILIGAIILGGIFGIIFGDKASIVSPLGDIFLNMMLIVVVPLIFLTISTSIYKMKYPKRIGKILVSTFFVFLITSIVSVFVGIVSTYSFKLIESSDSNIIKEGLSLEVEGDSSVELNLLERTVDALTVDDFSKLLSRDNMIALIVVSIIFGISLSMSKEKGEPLFKVLDSSLEVLLSFIKIIMYYAPIGLGCYFASLVGTYGNIIVAGYVKTFIIYLFVSIAFYFVIYSIYAYISGGVNGIKRFFKNVIPSTLTSLATCSSAASMPVNIECTKKIGVSSDIAEATVSLGASFHKDGSVIGSVFKIMFLVYLFNGINDISVFRIMLIALVATLLVTAVPVGGGTISEALIITMLGYPMGALPILTIIATIIDAPATTLNVVGDSAAAMIINRIVDGKKFLVNNKNTD